MSDKRYLTVGFDMIHDGLGLIRRAVEGTGDQSMIDDMGACDIALLKPLRALRLKLGVPYYSDESDAND